MSNTGELIKAANSGDQIMVLFIIASIIITLLFLALIFFVKKQITVVETLQDSVNLLNLTITRMEEKQNSDKESHNVINHRLNEHGNYIRDHETRITVIEKRT